MRTIGMETSKKCPYCGERINVEAIKCRFCREFLEDGQGLPVSNHAKKKLPPRTEEVQESESDGSESIVAVPSLWGIAGTLLSGTIFFALGVILLLWPATQLLQKIPNFPQNRQVLTEQYIRFAGLGIMFVVILVIAYKIAKVKSVRYEISADRIEWIRGIFSRQIDNLDMFRVVDIKLHRSLLDCILGIGTLTLMTKDSTDPTFDFEKIPRPRQVYDYIKTATLTADRKQGVIHIE
jgi:membrane protein YdbS with pleckstrin-like domain